MDPARSPSNRVARCNVRVSFLGPRVESLARLRWQAKQLRGLQLQSLELLELEAEQRGLSGPEDPELICFVFLYVDLE